MTDICLVTPDLNEMNRIVRETYTAVAEDPTVDFHFNVGLDYAVERLDYDRAELEALPATSTSRFAGLGNPLRIGPIHPHETVVDVGSGAGMDLLLAARRVGRLGRAIGVDPTPAMRLAAWRSACEAGLAEQVSLVDGDAEHIPLPEHSADVVISNGVLNLATDKPKALREFARVLKPGGRLYLADAMIVGSFKPAELADPNLWAH
ncbi:MAG: methyltransferase domain-containing protein [Planctomycetes bacterium]|nr:methyltransferase domain-containing protein [Planctomycetota bacterium]